ncbi:MAG: exonuclease SbcCD subunit D [Oscillospiraceae bacterium]|nr:exonuclease SbcCD subunit D [Oscillospiraceae bacterium]
MKLVHLSDLHLGKRLREYSLAEDQTYILDRILDVVDAERPDGVIIAGDVYDKSSPSAEAVALFDGFLSKLAVRGTPVFVISGNHDSAERIAYGRAIMSRSGVYLSSVYNGSVEPVILEDGYGAVNLYLLPFVRPTSVRAAFPDEKIDSYEDAVRTAIEHMNVDQRKRNVLVTHQFVTGAERSESETVSVGGSDNVDVSVFAPFDYVALGHIHRPQNCSTPRVRYCGTPLKYSFSEARDEKSVTVAELGPKGELNVRTVPLIPLRDLADIRGSYDEITLRSFYEGTGWQSDYVRITLTDEEEIPNVGDKLRPIYRNWMQILYDNRRTQADRTVGGTDEEAERSPLQLFSDLYEQQNNSPMTDEQTAFMTGLIEKYWEEEL